MELKNYQPVARHLIPGHAMELGSKHPPVLMRFRTNWSLLWRAIAVVQSKIRPCQSPLRIPARDGGAQPDPSTGPWGYVAPRIL